MITEEKQVKTQTWLIVLLLIFVIGVAIGWWSDKYFWPIICTVTFAMPAIIVINIMWRGWKR